MDHTRANAAASASTLSSATAAARKAWRLFPPLAAGDAIAVPWLRREPSP
jgi:hypothetical protein